MIKKYIFDEAAERVLVFTYMYQVKRSPEIKTTYSNIIVLILDSL